jgi:hypothetical protein
MISIDDGINAGGSDRRAAGGATMTSPGCART